MGHTEIDVNDFLKMTEQDLEKATGKKHFDIVIQNPPYQGSLHLKFLEKCIEIGNNVISIQPCRWLQDPFGKEKKNSNYNKYKENISKHIKDLEIINWEDCLNLFKIQSTDLGIYICDKEGGFDYNKISENNVVKKVIDYINENLCNIEHNKKDGYRVRISLISGMSKVIKNVALKDIVFKDGKYNGKWWYEYYQRNKHSKSTEEITASIKFKTEEEGYNFINSFKTKFVSYIESYLITDVSVNEHKILWMGNAKHPQSGKIGYESKWTDEDFYKYFNLNEDEIKELKKFNVHNADKL